jgi:hypothetical protein
MLSFSALRHATRAALFSMLLVMCLGTSVALAQEETTLWYPSVETLFAPGVRDVEVIVEDTPDPAWAHQAQIDNKARHLRIWDTDTTQWLDFDYPDGITHISAAERYDADRWLISTAMISDYPVEYDPTSQWLLDIHSGTFTRPELVCGQMRETRANESGQWVVYRVGKAPNTQISLCNTKTLEQHPITIEDYFEPSFGNASPDGTKVAFAGGENYYVYDLQTETLLRLGESNHHDFQYMDWYGNETVIVTESNMPDGDPWVNVSRGDAAQADSLTPIGFTLKYGTTTGLDFRQNPERVEWVNSSHGSCYLNWIEKETGHRERFLTGDVCEIGTLLSDDPYGDRLFSPVRYRPLYNPDNPDYPASYDYLYRDLVRLNPVSGERTELMRGEIEAVLDIDEGSNYAALVLDDNGVYDLLNPDTLSNVGHPDIPEPNHFQFVILDLHNGTILYRTPVASFGGGNYIAEWFDARNGQINMDFMPYVLGNVPAGSLFNIGNGQFVVNAAQVEMSEDGQISNATSLDDRLVEIKDGKAIETTLPGQVLMTTRGNAFFVTYSFDADSRTAAVSVYNAKTGNVTALMSELKLSGETFAWDKDLMNIERGSEPDMLDVKLSNSEAKQTVTYRVHLS